MPDYQSPIPSCEEWRKQFQRGGREQTAGYEEGYTAAKRAGDEALEELVEALSKAVELADNYCDDGPVGMEYQSEKYKATIVRLRALLAKYTEKGHAWQTTVLARARKRSVRPSVKR